MHDTENSQDHQRFAWLGYGMGGIAVGAASTLGIVAFMLVAISAKGARESWVFAAFAAVVWVLVFSNHYVRHSPVKEIVVSEDCITIGYSRDTKVYPWSSISVLPPTFIERIRGAIATVNIGPGTKSLRITDDFEDHGTLIRILRERSFIGTRSNDGDIGATH